MAAKIQKILAKNLRKANPLVPASSCDDETIGQAVIDSVNSYLEHYLKLNSQAELAKSIFSENLKASASFSARNARIAYLMGKVALLKPEDRKGIVRIQVLELGSVAEAILLDIVQSTGVNNTPPKKRPKNDNGGYLINWNNGGLFEENPKNRHKLLRIITFAWLIKESKRMNIIDTALANDLNWLKDSRNLIHAAIPTPQRYSDDLDSVKTAIQTVERLRDACVAFKTANHMPAI